MNADSPKSAMKKNILVSKILVLHGKRQKFSRLTSKTTKYKPILQKLKYQFQKKMGRLTRP